MMAYADQIGSDIEALEEAALEEGKIGASIRQLDSTLREANTAFNSRQEVMFGVS